MSAKKFPNEKHQTTVQRTSEIPKQGEIGDGGGGGDSKYIIVKLLKNKSKSKNLKGSQSKKIYIGEQSWELYQTSQQKECKAEEKEMTSLTYWKKKNCLQGCHIQWNYLLKMKVSWKIFQINNTERIHCQHTCTKKKLKMSLDKSLVPEEIWIYTKKWKTAEIVKKWIIEFFSLSLIFLKDNWLCKIYLVCK